MGVRLSLRPDLDQDVGLLALYVSGSLLDARTGMAYEGRLSIHNAAGACSVEQVGGDALPPGSSVYVDNTAQEVVVAWPAYAEYVTPLGNPSFESGDLSGWTLTPRGGVATATVDTAQKFDGTYSLRWPGGRGLGSEGGIEVEAWNNTIGPCLPGQRVTIHSRCMYNPAGHNFGSRYQGLLRFVDGAGVPIGSPARGKQFKGRGNNGDWNDASATAIAPVGTKGVQLGAWLTGSNAPVWMDAASWDVPSSVGINANALLSLTLHVRDSAGRSALWSGSINVTNSDPLAVSILAKLTAWWPLDSVNGAVMADMQPDVLRGGMTDAYLQYGSSRGIAAGRTAGRSAPAFAGNASPGGYITEVNPAGGPAPSSDMFPGSGDWCSFGWVWLNVLPTAAMSIVTRYNANDDGSMASVGMRYLDAGNGRVQGWFGNGTYSSIIPAGNIATGRWMFMLIQRKGNVMRTSLDMSVFGADTDVTGQTPLNHNHTYFGSQGPNFFLNGRLQDWGWVKGAHLTDEEMAWMYNAGAGRTIEQIRAAAGV